MLHGLLRRYLSSVRRCLMLPEESVPYNTSFSGHIPSQNRFAVSLPRFIPSGSYVPAQSQTFLPRNIHRRVTAASKGVRPPGFHRAPSAMPSPSTTTYFIYLSRLHPAALSYTDPVIELLRTVLPSLCMPLSDINICGNSNSPSCSGSTIG